MLFLQNYFTEPTSRDDVRQWAEQEAEWTGVLYTPQEPPLWTHGYIIYLKMYYETRRKWEAESDAAKLEVLFSHMSKYGNTYCPSLLRDLFYQELVNGSAFIRFYLCAI